MSLNSESHIKKLRESGLWETGKIIIQALLLALVVRVFFYQPFNIPSGSMKSTLLVGDYLFVSKLSYGYSRHTFPYSPPLFSGRIWSGDPKLGDVVVFKLPRDNTTDYIKRVVGLPGDTVQMRDGVLFINGEAVPKERDGYFETRDDDGRLVRIPKYRETLPNGVVYHVLDERQNGPADNTRVFTVPDGHYFMMGDNRDNSTDSRIAWGGVDFVPHENLVGRAEIIFFSAAFDDPDAFRLLTPWRWPMDVRWSRFFTLVR
ncbi:MAG: signal peptidase I [Hyphomicrobiaceae bacterium]